jgi:hypothetical protein
MIIEIGFKFFVARSVINFAPVWLRTFNYLLRANLSVNLIINIIPSQLVFKLINISILAY